MRNSSLSVRYAFSVVALALSAKAISAAELVIHVYPRAETASALPLCQTTAVFSCESTLPDALTIIRDPQWQGGLAGRFSSVKLQLAPGVHRLTAPLYLQWNSEATRNVRLEIAGTAQSTFVSGAVAIEDWGPAVLADLPARVAPGARGKLWVADLAHLDLPFNAIPHARGYGLPIRPVLTELFVDSFVQPVAAWPNNNGYAKLKRPAHLPPEDRTTFSIAGRNAGEWADEPDLQGLAFWNWDWASQSYLIASKNVQANELTLFGTGSPYGIKSGQRVRIENALAELDTPGEWYVDRASSKLYYFPAAQFQGKGGEVSLATGLLVIDGATNVLIHDLVFEKTRGDALSVKNSRDIAFDHVVVRLTGNRGLVIENSFNSGIRNSLIEDNGDGAVLLSGGNRQTLQSANNFVENSVIRRFSRLSKTYRFAVELAGVGQRVIGTSISDAPHTAILFKGNEHRILNNEIFNVVRETGDAGAIYTGRDYTAYGTVIEGNFIHDIASIKPGLEVKGIYLDDQASGTTVRGNIFARVQQPVFLGGGRDNLIENNLFFQSSPGVHLDARGLHGDRHETLSPQSTLQKGLNAVPYSEPIYAARYPRLATIREDNIGAPKYNVFRRNTVVNGKVSSIEDIAKSGIEITNNRQTDDSVFLKTMLPNQRNNRSDFNISPTQRISNPTTK